MAATAELVRSGTNSASFYTVSDGGNPIIGAAHWAQLPEWYQTGFYWPSLPAAPQIEVYVTDPAAVRVALAYSASE